MLDCCCAEGPHQEGFQVCQLCCQLLLLSRDDVPRASECLDLAPAHRHDMARRSSSSSNRSSSSRTPKHAAVNNSLDAARHGSWLLAVLLIRLDRRHGWAGCAVAAVGWVMELGTGCSHRLSPAQSWEGCFVCCSATVRGLRWGVVAALTPAWAPHLACSRLAMDSASSHRGTRTTGRGNVQSQVVAVGVDASVVGLCGCATPSALCSPALAVAQRRGCGGDSG